MKRTDRIGDRIIGKEYKYVNTAVLVPIVRIDNKKQLLLEKRNSDIRQGNELCFPGGKCDKARDKNAEETAIRETVEELGVPRELITIRGKLGTIVAPLGVTVDAFIGNIDIASVNDVKINTAEVQEAFCLPLEWLRKHPPREYSVRIEIQPYYVNRQGEREHLFPSRELGLPERYASAWGSHRYPIFVCQTEYGTIWGITAELIREFMKREI